MKSFSYSDLDKLTGEVLPERAVLSTLLAGGGGNSNGNENHNLNLGGGGSTGTTAVVPLCQSTVSSHEGILGVLNADNESSFTCAGAAVVSGH
ncbi:hypothetical protein [Actinomadura sp. WMMA1423]|uniref:hypothetical protein n=1 Tax=Actinomadura sp. WMMA1423 TaxID=2591108 RepID=UPI0011471677|nr:hypothetical protein [Actinomadura sp. WMMA1423]